MPCKANIRKSFSNESKGSDRIPQLDSRIPGEARIHSKGGILWTGAATGGYMRQERSSMFVCRGDLRAVFLSVAGENHPYERV